MLGLRSTKLYPDTPCWQKYDAVVYYTMCTITRSRGTLVCFMARQRKFIQSQSTRDMAGKSGNKLAVRSP